MIFMRLGRGIRDHFHVRATEWLMAYPGFGMWFAFQLQPDMFTASPSFSVLDRWADEQTWAVVVLSCAFLRLGALSVNGTFQRRFPWTPHLRVIASFAGIFFWSQWTLGFVSAYLAGAGALSAVVAYSTFCLAELLNIYRGFADISAGWRGPNGADRKH
ncbi:MAG: hypothetical protein ABGW90_10245 [Martelella sp.]